MSRASSDTGAEASFASLGPTLLARKGGAKPAMRPQLAPLPEAISPESSPVDAEKLEDLGWNDMGNDLGNDTGEANEGQLPVPAKPKKSVKSKKTKSAPKTSKKSARRAAFTLRLDADRHLKLRLAATMHGMSSQALVTQALDAMFGEIDDLEALASRMKRN